MLALWSHFISVLYVVSLVAFHFPFQMSMTISVIFSLYSTFIGSILAFSVITASYYVFFVNIARNIIVITLRDKPEH
jgi:hypothetical protein